MPYPGRTICPSSGRAAPGRSGTGLPVTAIPAKGHHEDPKIKKALIAAEDLCETLAVLGSFPMAKLSDE